MVKKGSKISMSIGSGGCSLGSARSSSYSGGSSGYSLVGSGGGYSLTSASKGYILTNRLEGSSKTGYSSMASGGYVNAGMKTKGYSIKQRLYGPVSLFPVPYSRAKETQDNEMFRKYKKKCPSYGKESMGSGSYSLN